MNRKRMDAVIEREDDHRESLRRAAKRIDKDD